DLALVDAKRLVEGRDRAHFKDLADAVQRLRQVSPLATETGLAVATRYFAIEGTVTYGAARLSARALVRRQPNRLETLWRKERARLRGARRRADHRAPRPCGARRAAAPAAHRARDRRARRAAGRGHAAAARRGAAARRAPGARRTASPHRARVRVRGRCPGGR